MPEANRKRLNRTTFLYWMLLLYIIAALVWWFISLTRQNTVMRDFEISNLQSTVNQQASPKLYEAELSKINAEHATNRSKYIGEGTIFLLFILLGAAFVYRSVRRQFNMQLQQQNFMMAVTHELKTPISVARLNLETMQRYTLDPEKQQRLIRNTIDETSRLNILTNNILIASQLDGGGYKASKDELDLSDLFADCIQDFKSRFPDRVIEADIAPDAAIKGDALLLQMLINNLLENALKYSGKQTIVSASLVKKEDAIQVSIKDQGPGISDDEKKKVFEKFYRVGNEDIRKTQGTGLGLYLCKRIAKGHKGSIDIINNEPRGSIFVVTFKNS